MTKQSKRLPAPTLDEIGEQLLGKLVANLLDERENYSKALPFDVSQLPLDGRYDHYKHALAIIAELWPLPCSPEHLTTTLHLRGVENAEAFTEALLALRTQRPDTDPLRVVRTSVHQFQEWYRRISKIDRLKKALALAEAPGGMTPDEEDRAINAELTQIAPLTVRVETLDLEERHRIWLQEQSEAVRKAHLTGATVPMWPWEPLNDHVSGLQKGDPALFGAATKFGKTTIGDICAEYWAWIQGYYVCVIALETTFHSYERRFIARHAGIPTRFFAKRQRVLMSQYHEIEVGPIDPLDPYWGPHIGPDFTRKIIAKYNTGGGLIQHRRIKGGGDGMQVADVMRDFTLNVAQPAGKEPIFVIDYLQAMTYDGRVEERIGLTRNVNFIKDATDALGVYTMLLSQEALEDPNKGVEKAKSRRVTSFGSTMPVMRTQQYLSLKRPLATEDEPVQTKTSQRPFYNALGEERFWAKKDAPSGKHAQIVVAFANEGVQGASVQVMFEGALFNCLCPVRIRRAMKDKNMWGGLPHYPMLVDENYNQDEIDGLSLSG